MTKWMAVLTGLAVFSAALVLYWHTLGTPWMQEAAQSHAKAYISAEYTVDNNSLTVTSSVYSRESDRFAVTITGAHGEIYEAAVRMKNRHEAALILDVTGQFDAFGLSYCH
ncbi:hypothetical protein CR205_05655 [Alteribacter lacisalsi]|uniref:Uncharacterized protein n=1 Tax=Alteribacter lacisalsi TaxID=2045244 RepID=A0A2W0HM04_9BACI|nr:hypothetical protein [Alteribacter lacisalsi]PYZ98082.1 hypothetical protein CR205_05655 [Alteribacter lacisalsi]